ncbi:hypothetical protein COL26b_011507 [Colletotrichum chrysophilum]|nr:uncharacterized protein COL26b_011507 [Colletotrichum chrysophilum]KAJ0366839.1 hypothetical protein COL26b_011507 [Colletotrichum chrysophilum]
MSELYCLNVDHTINPGAVVRVQSYKAHLPILSETPTSIIAAKMHLSKQILTVVTALLFASAGVQAGCTTESPGTQGFYGGKCNSDKVFCGYAPSGGYSITCCDTKACE